MQDDPTQVDPMLAVWQYGLGKTAAFTSDLSPNWGADWYDWDKFQPFVKQLVDRHLPRQQGRTSCGCGPTPPAATAVIIVEDFHPDEAFLEMHGPACRGRAENGERCR